jgi:hypothetical protein
MLKRRLALLLTAGAIAGLPATAGASPASSPIAIATKSCSAGYTHATIGGAHKCLRRGQFCAHSKNRQYRRYGFQCRKQDARGNYHLT